MKRSKGTYLQGVQYAESLLLKFIEDGQDPSEQFYKMIQKDECVPCYYYDGKHYCDGFYDYIDYFIDNKELIFNNFKGLEK